MHTFRVVIRRATAVALLTVTRLLLSLPVMAQQQPQYIPDAECTVGQAWMIQTDERSDLTGKNNINFPLQQATYWGTLLSGSDREVVTIQGRFPAARYMSVQVYNYDRNVLGSLRDIDIEPDPGQVNPYRPGGGNAQGTYTLRLVFGRPPLRGPAPNTLYTGTTTSVALLYRIYYANNPDDITAGTSNPVLPIVTVRGVPLTTCPPRPIKIPQTATVWGRLDRNNFAGVKPDLPTLALNPPVWGHSATDGSTRFFPSQDNSYMNALLSRKFLSAPYRNDLVVMRMRAPSFVDTQSGVPPSANADVRFWSVCTNEVLSTGVTRCVPDNRASIVNGFATFVISDPNRKPSDDLLRQWGANWIAWGALAPGESIYNAWGQLLTNADGVFYNNLLIYRQTVPNPAFAASMLNAFGNPTEEARRIMGDYWPTIGYCSLQNFQALGPDCSRR